MKDDIREYSNKIKKANKFYTELTQLKVFSTGNLNEKIQVLETIAFFNWHVHSGRYDSSFINDKIDLLTLEIPTNANLPEIELAYPRFVIFIASELYEIGGHTRLLENIAKYELEKGRKNILIITDQLAAGIPSRILNQKGDLFKQIISLAGKKSIEKILAIRSLAKNAYRIYNSQHPDDIEPSIALNFSNRPFTIYVNHADHVFWIGAKYCDCILNIRPFAERLSRNRRNNSIPSIILPIKLDLNKKCFSRNEARDLLKIGRDKIILLTISSFYKIIPDNNYNIFITIKKLLALNENIEYYFIGINRDNYVSIMHENPPDRLLLLGVVEDPVYYQCAADFYLEGMPMNSLTALLESIFAGAFPVLMWGPNFVNMNVEEELCIDNLIRHAKNEVSYIDNIKILIDQRGHPHIQQVVNDIKQKMKYYNSKQYWDKELDNIAIKVASSKNNRYKEFDCDIPDIHLYQSWETFWSYQKTNVYELIMKKIKTHLSFFQINIFFVKYVLSDPLIKNIDKLKIYKRVIKNKLTYS